MQTASWRRPEQQNVPARWASPHRGGCGAPRPTTTGLWELEASMGAAAQQELLPLLTCSCHCKGRQGVSPAWGWGCEMQRRERCRGVRQGWEGRLQPVGLEREPCLQKAPGNSQRKQPINPGPAWTVILLAAFPPRLRHGLAATELQVPGCSGDAALRAAVPRPAAWHS